MNSPSKDHSCASAISSPGALEQMRTYRQAAARQVEKLRVQLPGPRTSPTLWAPAWSRTLH
ncbi:hypothetical protein [Streptomyces sp. BBFR102]|uniref:hypothetical protein n=1 Tax=Streptomyces sp. BBFR102 TaxID=3448171 RepID=UPI003F52BF34